MKGAPGRAKTIQEIAFAAYTNHPEGMEAGLEAVDYYANPFTDLKPANSNVEPIGPENADVLAPKYFNARKMTIYGGSSEVQRNILAKVMLGL